MCSLPFAGNLRNSRDKSIFARALFLSVFLLAAEDAFPQSYVVTTVAGSTRLGDGNAATSVPLRYPYGVAQDAAGNIYFADALDNRVRKVGTDGKISTVAGTGVAGFSGDGGPATKAMLDSPEGLRLDSKGANLYIGDYNNNRVRMVALATGTITTVAGMGVFIIPAIKVRQFRRDWTRRISRWIVRVISTSRIF